MLHKQIQNWMNATTTKQKQLSKTCLAFSFGSPKMTASFPCFKLTRCDIFTISVVHIWQHKSFSLTLWHNVTDHTLLTGWQPVFDSHAMTTYPIWTEVCSRVLTRSRGWSSRVDMEPLRAPARNDLVTGDWSRKRQNTALLN